MSAFLGPIHIMMYDRILYQDKMTLTLLKLAAEKDPDSRLSDYIDTETPAASKQSLDLIIDESNIHDWLSKAVSICEERFAMTVSSILEKSSANLEELCDAMKALGRTCGIPIPPDAEQAFQNLHSILLDGMPCDFPFVTTNSDQELVSWHVANCPHTPHWTGKGCSGDIYYQLRDAWMEGALENSKISHSRTDPYMHQLKRSSES